MGVSGELPVLSGSIAGAGGERELSSVVVVGDEPATVIERVGGFLAGVIKAPV
jgi:hypothetical protein